MIQNRRKEIKRGFSLSTSLFFGAIFALTSFSNPPEVFAQRCRDKEIRARSSRNADFRRGSEWSTTNSRLVFQNDGNLVLFGSSNNVLWATGTENRADRLSIQRDGNVVLYNSDQAVWATNTDKNPGAFLTLQCDGNLVVYDDSRERNAIWQTRTDGGRQGATNANNSSQRSVESRGTRSSQTSSGAVPCECTEYVRNRDFGEKRIGIRSAYQADPRLADHGYRKLSLPEIGAIVVFQPSFPGAHRTHGHIGYVEEIRSDGSLLVKGSNQGSSNNFTDAGCNNVNVTLFKTSVTGRSDVSFWKR